MARARSSLVRIRGLPWGAGHQEVHDFFYPLKLQAQDPITLINGPAGRPTGEAYVRFESEETAERALQYHKEMIGKRYIEVFAATELDLDASINRQGVRDFSDGIIRCRGLPFRCTVAEVAEFFARYGITEKNVILGIHISGRYAGGPNGEAWVKFRNEDVAKRALKERNYQCIGNRYVELYLSSEAERQQLQSSSSWGKARSWSAKSDDELNRNSGTVPGMCTTALNARNVKQPEKGLESSEVWLRARGLPYSASQQDVAGFFHGYGVDAIDVNISLGEDGNPTGEAHIRFTSKRQAHAAQAALHRKWLGKRYVEIFPPGPRSNPASAPQPSQQTALAPLPAKVAGSSAPVPQGAKTGGPVGRTQRSKGRFVGRAQPTEVEERVASAHVHTVMPAPAHNDVRPRAAVSHVTCDVQQHRIDGSSAPDSSGNAAESTPVSTEEACETVAVTRTPTSGSASDEASEAGDVTDEDDSCVGIPSVLWSSMHPVDVWRDLPSESVNALLGDGMVFPLYDPTANYMTYGAPAQPYYFVAGPYAVG